jgi:hypothetical protein
VTLASIGPLSILFRLVWLGPHVVGRGQVVTPNQYIKKHYFLNKKRGEDRVKEYFTFIAIRCIAAYRSEGKMIKGEW